MEHPASEVMRRPRAALLAETRDGRAFTGPAQLLAERLVIRGIELHADFIKSLSWMLEKSLPGKLWWVLSSSKARVSHFKSSSSSAAVSNCVAILCANNFSSIAELNAIRSSLVQPDRIEKKALRAFMHHEWHIIKALKAVTDHFLSLFILWKVGRDGSCVTNSSRKLTELAK